jgi:hypothetical protein
VSSVRPVSPARCVPEAWGAGSALSGLIEKTISAANPPPPGERPGDQPRRPTVSPGYCDGQDQSSDTRGG